MPAREPFGLEDFVLERPLKSHEYRSLLQDDGLPRGDLDIKSEQALARIASRIFLDFKDLDDQQFEQIIKWLKTLKLRNTPLARECGVQFEFYNESESQKNNSEQISLQKQAFNRTIASRIWGMLFGIAVTVFLSCLLIGAPWYATVITFVLSAWMLTLSDKAIIEAITISKKQDRKYFFALLRKAETLNDVSDAGLFEYLPGTYEKGMPFDEEAAKTSIRAEKTRLTDAIYTDPWGYAEPR